MSTLTPPPDADQLVGPPPRITPYLPPQPQPSNTLGIAAMVTGIVGLVLTPSLGLYLIGGPLGLILGPTAMVVGWIGRRRARQGLAVDNGFALIGLLLGLVTLLVAIGVSGLELWLFTGDWD